MKLLAAILLLFFSFNKLSAQKYFSCSDSLHSFNVLTDSTLSTDGANSDCSVKTISVYSKNKKKLLQTIEVPENDFSCDAPQDEILLFEDVNFDGYDDFMIRQFLPAAPNVPYHFYVFDKHTQLFQRDTTLEAITSPDFNKEDKVISSFWRDGYGHYGISIYKYIDGKITLI